MSPFKSLEEQADQVARQGGADTKKLADIVTQLCRHCEELEKRIEETHQHASRIGDMARGMGGLG